MVVGECKVDVNILWNFYDLIPFQIKLYGHAIPLSFFGFSRILFSL